MIKKEVQISPISPGYYCPIQFLLHLIKDEDNVVELGVFKGESIPLLMEKNGFKGTYTGVDAWSFTEEYFQGDLGALSTLISSGAKESESQAIAVSQKYEKCNLLKGNTHEVYKNFEDESIDFLFIDACHSYEAVKKDIELWWPKVKIGGIISGDDFYGIQVFNAVIDVVEKAKNHEVIGIGCKDIDRKKNPRVWLCEKKSL